jgi:hypothetical protein
MTIECAGYFDERGMIHNTEPQRLEPMRKVHKRGEYVRIIFDDTEESTFLKAFKLFHAYRDQWAVQEGLEKDYAKALLKYRYGSGTLPWVDGFQPPVGERGSFLEVESRIYWMKSTTIYTGEELGVLIEGVIKELNHVE